MRKRNKSKIEAEQFKELNRISTELGEALNKMLSEHRGKTIERVVAKDELSGVTLIVAKAK